ncbi:chemotaxis protein CheB [Pedobacter sp. AW1-32]|uniref:chemotaxis protein CheB n=1 Tax=Pedobacter sp. AW1-32 TaxID=3383026 RepID=UPI003FEFD6C3
MNLELNSYTSSLMQETQSINKDKSAQKRYDKYIVAIGASAGGLEAIHEFFDHMPATASFSFVVIQHLSSDYKSLLVELVGKHTHMKVFEATHDMAIQQDCVYIIPNNKLMTLEKGRLKLADKSTEKAPNTAIDTFLHTLAKDKKEKAIAIILSGTGTDGTKGIQSIKDNGGMVIVQDPTSAKFDGMPNSAISSGNVDYIELPAQMHEQLFNYVHEEPIKILENGQVDEAMLDEIFNLVHEHSGNDFNLYKTPTIIRRIGRRMNERNVKKLQEYINLLQHEPDEVKLLGQDFLIGVTKFFRDAKAFEQLSEVAISEIVAKKENGEAIKIWVCACSTGQEAYSIAALVNDVVDRSGKRLEIKIFASDIDEKSIEIAARNEYPLSVKNEIPPHLLKKYFVQEGKFYRVVPHIRKQIVFARHDVIKSPPFIKNDLITCRNMLIYVNTILQEKILSTFHFSLNTNGFLFLGSSETATPIKAGITEVSSKAKIYTKTGKINYSTYNTYNTSHKTIVADDRKRLQTPVDTSSPLAAKMTEFISKDLGYVGINIDRAYVMKDAVGDYRKYLSLPEFKIELNLLKMVPRDVSVVLNAGLRKAWKEQLPQKIQKVRFKQGERDMMVDISIVPPDASNEMGATMVIFVERQGEEQHDRQETDVSILHEGAQAEYVYELEAELNDTRTNLQMAVEEMETTNEELQSSNEELLSANEELQSSNEELQSLNEELHTLNTEHQLKIKELFELNDDLNNYFRSTNIGQIFLDATMLIRKFNPAAVAMVNLIDADVGRSIEHISNNIKLETLTADIKGVLASGINLEKEVQLRNGSRSLMRIMPYVRKDGKTDGAVVSFVDITQLTELNNIISGVFNASLNAILAFRTIRDEKHFITDFECITYNDSALALLGEQYDTLRGQRLAQLPILAANHLMQKYHHVVEKGESLQTDIVVDDQKWYQLVAVKMSDGFVLTLTDLSQQKLAEQKLKKNYNELLLAREKLKGLNSELEVKVQERTLELSQSEERFNLVSHATNDTIWDWDLANNTMWRSDNFVKMFGYENKDEHKNIGFWFERIHPQDRERVKRGVYDSINHNETQWNAEYRFLKANGEYATLLDRGTIQTDHLGTPYRMVGSIIDISQLVDTEFRLSTTERKFKKIFESNVIGILFSNTLTGRIDDANDVFLDLLGYTREDFESGNIDWMSITTEQSLPISQISAKLLKEQGFCPPFEKQYVRKDGQIIEVMVGSALLDEEGRTEAVTYVIDISKQKYVEKKRAELQKLVKKQQDEFYSIFKNAPALITIRRGKELRYEFVNEAFRKFDGGEDYIGKSELGNNSQFEAEQLKAIERRVLETGRPFMTNAYKFTKVDAESKSTSDAWYDLIVNPVFSDNGEIDGIAFFGFEVTELINAKEATEELMNRKDEFMSIASHELKTPITSIKGFLQFALRMAEQRKFEQIYSFIDKANKQIEKLTTLVNDLLDVTKIQAGKMIFNFSEFDIEDVIGDALDGVQAQVNQHLVIKNIEPATIYGDRNRIEQVLSNFISNAIKYSPDGKKIIITAGINEGKLRVSVQDFGIGIPKSKSKFVFDRFFRVEESSHLFAGLGLGLYISAEIVHRHNGEIGVDSQEGEGATFWFEIPLENKMI